MRKCDRVLHFNQVAYFKLHPPDLESGVEHSSSSTPAWRRCPPIFATVIARHLLIAGFAVLKCAWRHLPGNYTHAVRVRIYP